VQNTPVSFDTREKVRVQGVGRIHRADLLSRAQLRLVLYGGIIPVSHRGFPQVPRILLGAK
jgi:hypothetical protein